MTYRRTSRGRIRPQNYLTDPNRTIVIITSATKGLETTERYLFARNWQIHIVRGSLSKGLQTATLCQAGHLFVSTDVIPDEFNDLYRALKKSFGLILFAERPNAQALKLLQALGPREVCLTPLTGPMVERLIAKRGFQSRLTEQRSDFKPDQGAREIARMATAADIALVTLYSNMAHQPRMPLGHCTHFHCFAVHTSRLCGYLVVATNGDLNSHLSEQFRQQIAASMQSGGEFFRVGDIQELTLREVQFEGLALAYGEFFRKTAHQGHEVAISFFRISEPDVVIGDSHDEGWVSASIKNLTPGETIDFDLYVYLPANQKFVLYRKSGQTILGSEVTRLENRGVKNIHIRRDEIPSLQRYKAKSYLNSLVWNFQQDNTAVTAI